MSTIQYKDLNPGDVFTATITARKLDEACYDIIDVNSSDRQRNFYPSRLENIEIKYFPLKEFSRIQYRKLNKVILGTYLRNGWVMWDVSPTPEELVKYPSTEYYEQL